MIVRETDAVPPAGVDLGRLPVTVTLELTNGTVLEKEVTASPGSREDPMTLAQLKHKWTDCLAHGLAGRMSRQRSEALFDEGSRLAALEDAGAWLDSVLSGTAESA